MDETLGEYASTVIMDKHTKCSHEKVGSARLHLSYLNLCSSQEKIKSTSLQIGRE